jgi:site-specific DNA-adenine methylase
MHTKPIVLTQWAGSKRRLLPQYLPAFPEGDTFTDLFGGSGIVTANVNYEHKYLNELQSEWLDALSNLTHHTDEVVAEYEKVVAEYMLAENPKTHYEWLLRQYTGNYSEYNPYWEAAALILCVQSCFGGMWTNYLWAKGRYSTPYGKRNMKYPSDKLRTYADSLAGTTFTSLDWKEVELKGFVFADPPYRSNYGNPVDYDTTHEVNHEDLANKLKAHGSFAYCATDLGDGWLQDNFPNYKTVEVQISHTAKRSGAEKETEVLVVGEGE